MEFLQDGLLLLCVRILLKNNKKQFIIKITSPNMSYKITAFSNWILPQIFWANSIEKTKEIKVELKNQQYLVEIEEVAEIVE